MVELPGSSYAERIELKEANVDFVMALAKWKSFITLTFKNDVSDEYAMRRLRLLIAVLNERVYGKHYTRIVGHSYFSYCVGIEYQVRDVIHFHVLVDEPIDYQLLQSYWGSQCGFAWITGIEDMQAVVTYVAKYTIKDGVLFMFRKKKEFVPDRKNPMIDFYWRAKYNQDVNV